MLTPAKSIVGLSYIISQMENYFLEVPEQSQLHGTSYEAAQNYSGYQNVALARLKHDAIFQILVGYLLMDYFNFFLVSF